MQHTQVVDQLPALRRYARVLTGDAWVADDLVQDTLERACLKWHLWRPGSNLRAWLFALMHNIYLNQRRNLVPVEPLDAEAHASLPGAAGVAGDVAIDLERCLQRLPADQRAVLLLVTLEDMTYADVARVLRVPVGTVMSRLARSRVRLHELLEAEPRPAPGTLPDAGARLRRMK